MEVVTQSSIANPRMASLSNSIAIPLQSRPKFQQKPTTFLFFPHHCTILLSISSSCSSGRRFGFSPGCSPPLLLGAKGLFAAPEVGVSTETNEWGLQDFYTLRKEVETISERVEEIRAAAGLSQLEEDIKKLEAAATDSCLWDDHAKAQGTLQSLTDLKDKLKLLNDFKAQRPFKSKCGVNSAIQTVNE